MRNRKTIASAVFLTTLLSGCQSMMETMFTHIVLPDPYVERIAQANAFTNICLAFNSIDKNVAYAFSSASAQLVDITVIDRDLYKRTYEGVMNLVPKDIPKGVEPDLKFKNECAQLERNLPAVTKRVSDQYMQYSRELSVARAQERQQMAAMLSNMGSGWTKQNYSATYGWPRVTYIEEKPAATNFLVSTSNGMINCRTTNKNFVFCF